MSIKKFLLWYCMFTKRLFHKLSFVILLCCIPVLVAVTSSVMDGESGILTILLCSEDENSEADKIINSLLEDDSVILFKRAGDVEGAVNEVKQHKADAVWCFEDDFDEKTEKFATHKSMNPLVTVYEREDSIPLQLSHEKLYGAIYGSFSYEVYKNFVYTKLVNVNQISDEELESYYNGTERRADIVKTEGTKTLGNNDGRNYLTAPLRGILAIMIMLCGLAGAMYFIKDKNNGKFNWMPAEKRIIPAFAQCLASIVPSVVAVFVAIGFTDISVGFDKEIISMILFVFASAGFCLLMSIIFRSSGKLGATVPALLILMLAFSPVFFNIEMLKPVSLMLPTYYYLNYVYNPLYSLYFLIYIIGLYILCCALNFALKGRER